MQDRNWLKETRIKKGYKQADLAEKMGISQAAYSKIELGNTVSVKTAKNISEILGLDWTKFYGEDRWQELKQAVCTLEESWSKSIAEAKKAQDLMKESLIHIKVDTLKEVLEIMEELEIAK